MSDPFFVSLLTFLLLWAILSGVYCAAILAADRLLTGWSERREEQRALQARLNLINADVAASLDRLAVAFAIAQRDMRDAARQDGPFRRP